MADTTTNYGLPFPEGGDGVVVHTDIERLAKRADGALAQQSQDILDQVAREHVASDEIRRIIPTTNVNITTQPGDLLVVTEPPRFYTDFRFDDLGTTPDGWVPALEAGPGSWTVEASPATPSGKILRSNNPAGARIGLAWEEPPASEIVEVLIKTRSTNQVADTGRPTIDGRMPLGGVWGYLHNNRLSSRIVVSRNGSTTEDGNITPIPHLEPGLWTYLRLRREPDRTYLKSWVEGTPEPDAWGSSLGLVEPLAPGWVGVQSSSDAAEIAFVAVALDGGEAPKHLW